MRLVVYADGASRGNPGPASIGASVQSAAGDELASVSETMTFRRSASKRCADSLRWIA